MVLPLHFSQYVIDPRPRESVNALVEVNLFKDSNAVFWIFISFLLATPKMNDFDHISIAVSSNSLRRRDLESFDFNQSRNSLPHDFQHSVILFFDWHFFHSCTRKNGLHKIASITTFHSANNQVNRPGLNCFDALIISLLRAMWTRWLIWIFFFSLLPVCYFTLLDPPKKVMETVYVLQSKHSNIFCEAPSN